MHDHDRGLSFDMATLITRRRALQLAAAGRLAALVGCGSSSSGSSGGASGGPGERRDPRGDRRPVPRPTARTG